MTETKKDKEITVEEAEAEERERLLYAPRLELVQQCFLLSRAGATAEEQQAAKDKIMEAIKEKDMGPYYEHVCSQYGWSVDAGLLAELKKKNEEQLKKLEAAIADAVENYGETEIREAHLAKADYLCTIGDKEAAVAAYEETTKKTVSLGHKLDIVFTLIRLGMFYNDSKIVKSNLEKADEHMDAGGDWDRRNRLKIYRGTHSASIREFEKAANVFLDTVSTFTAFEILDYRRFIEVTVLISMMVLPRVELNQKVVKGPEIQEKLHESPVIKKYLDAFYHCDYAQFFKSLAEVDELLMKDSLLAPHRRFYIREMRIRAYTQLLESYRSVTLESMAKSFGVSTEFIDKELSYFIAAKRLNCKIDKVAGVVTTNRPDKKNAQYQTAIKQGDLLLNHIQKLSQVVNI